MSRPQKRQNTSHPNNQNRDENAIADPTNVESSPKIFKLNIDCIEEIFEYLSWKDLNSVGETCKQMNKVAGEYTKQHFLSSENFCTFYGKDTTFTYNNYGVIKFIELSGFKPFMESVSICKNNIASDLSEFKSMDKILFDHYRLDNKKTEQIKSMLPQIEHFRLRCCSIQVDFYESMLKHCENLKILEYVSTYKRMPDYTWLSREYPKLEHLKLLASPHRIKELSEFFVHNPNVQNFSTTPLFLGSNSDAILSSNVKLNVLKLIGPHERKQWYEKKETLDLLNRLYEQGFYKKLHIYAPDFDDDFGTFLISLKGLELVSIRNSSITYNMSQLTNLKELIISNGQGPADMEILAKGLVNLEHLYIKNADIDDIMPFICRSAKLNKIKMFPRSKNSFNGGNLNLKQLNEERTKLAGARKITIYASDSIFLPTKWATQNGETDLSLIKMRRVNSHEWKNYII